MLQTSSRRLGELLIERKVLSRDVLEVVLDREAREGTSISRLLVQEGIVGEKDMIAAIAQQVALPFIDLTKHAVRPDLDKRLPEEIAVEHNAVVVDKDHNGFIVAMENPTDDDAMSAVTKALGGEPFVACLAVKSELVELLEAMYGGGGEVSGGDHVTDTHLNEMLERVLDLDGSDLHLSSGVHPGVRVNGEIKQLTEFPVMNPSEIRRMVYDVLTQRQREKFESEMELDTSHSIPGRGRFRVNVMFQRNSVGAVMRTIPDTIVPLETLGLPEAIDQFTQLHRGLVLVTGPTGSGKSTTLASMVDVINSGRAGHIMTVEDPIEFIHRHKKSIVNQREIGEDTHSFGQALKHVLRQDPDVILVGEMRDLETIHTALTAAETGHLVFGTLHTQDAPQAVDRVIDVFPAHQQSQVRVQLSSALMGVVTQQLVPKLEGGRAVACEIMVVTPAIRNLIREGKTHQIYSALQSGGSFGMQTMDQSLARLVRRNVVSMQDAVDRCVDEKDLKRMIAQG
ncbi:MAG: PilT/PilU family type 4a pilus ATPase [Actinomycetia bacterium]|nr:PilT/PilU family type 4a pilus ATPase [Actinomycetes bacterium]MCP4958890.1 PilT/PilU family type 4a pilus ATPase [Actinomycetes bacterium]